MKLIVRFIKPLFFALLLIAANASHSNAQSATQTYAAKYKTMALQLAQEFGIPAPVILAVAIIESSSGQGRNCHDLNNHFGIVGRNNVARKTRYKQYTSVEASFRDFCGLMTRKAFYARLKGNMNVVEWAKAISKAGYSEQPSVWQARVVGVIQNNKL